MKINIEKYEGSLLAKTTISHIGNEKTGNTPLLRTIFMYVDGIGEVAMPYISGNGIRGKLRRMLIKDFFDILGIHIDDISTKLYHTFFTGGALTSTEDTYATIDLELRRKIRELIIPISLLGCAIGNQMIQGKLKVGHAFPVCKEYKMYLPDFLKKDARAEKPVRTFTDDIFMTRKDDLKADREEEDNPVQMKVDYECFIPGTKFYHWFILEHADDIEKSCFGRMINLFKLSPVIGGKGNTGYGEVIFDYKPDTPKEDTYMEFMIKNKDKIKELLNELEAMA